MKFLNVLTILAVIALTVACNESDAENAIEDVGESMSETIDDAADSAEDAMDDAADAMEEAVE